ncbi:VOC family protein [Nocardia sp. NPDC049190]|uniref:VOC family protein n=1 Tax=Nocardia sp. NPDC049190 TaxID=3155650 RepID=UPI0033EEDABE
MTNPTTAETGTRTAVWPTLAFRDAHAMAAFLVAAFGFRQSALYTRADDPSIVEHAELRWPLGGGIMFGSAGKDDGPFGARPPGHDAVYLVCENPDALFARATAAGADVVQGLRDEEYGSRGFTVRDPEGNLWSFGTYWGS